MQEFVIRDAIESDAAAIQHIYGYYVRETSISFEIEPPQVEEMLSRMQRATERLPWVVFESDGNVLGYSYATQFRARTAYQFSAETTVYVDHESRRRGIGRTLMKHMLRHLRETGFHRAIAGVTLPNASSVGLHESLGFKQVGVFTQIGQKFGAWHDVGFWELDLTSQKNQD